MARPARSRYRSRRNLSGVGFRLAPHVWETYKAYLAAHPVIEMEVRRAAEMGSPLVRLTDIRCEDCGWEYGLGPIFIDALKAELSAVGEEMPAGCVPSDLLEAVRITHAWDQRSRETYCGGICRFKAGL
jgi:hypothetical protein